MLAVLLAGAIYAALVRQFGWFESIMLLLPIYLVINILLLVMCRGGVLRLVTLRRLSTRVLSKLPEDAVLLCSGAGAERKVQLVKYDPDTGAESLMELWRGRVLGWGRGARVVSRIRRQASRQFSVGVLVFALVTIPSLGGALWVGFNLHWTGFVLAAFVVATNFFAYLLLLPSVLAEPMLDALDSIL